MRCLGVVVGASLAATLPLFRPGGEPWAWAVLPLSLAAPVDFTMHELGIRKSSQLKRFVTGMVFGPLVAAVGCAMLCDQWLLCLALVSWYCLVQIGCARALSSRRRLDALVERCAAAWPEGCGRT